MIIGLADQLESSQGGGDEPRQLARIIDTEVFRLDFQLENIFMSAELEVADVEAKDLAGGGFFLFDGCELF